VGRVKKGREGGVLGVAVANWGNPGAPAVGLTDLRGQVPQL
jgi:hypothetical protein